MYLVNYLGLIFELIGFLGGRSWEVVSNVKDL